MASRTLAAYRSPVEPFGLTVHSCPLIGRRTAFRIYFVNSAPQPVDPEEVRSPARDAAETGSKSRH